MTQPVRIAVLISGAGSNMAALIDAANAGAERAGGASHEVVLVVSNRPDAGGLAIAEAKGVTALAIDHRPFGKDREGHERAVHDALIQADVQVIALAGYMRILTPWLVRSWAGRMLNIHPSLLPLYPGVDTHARAIAAGDAEAGCTVHLVTDGVDEGPILGQARVPILTGDTAETLSERVRVAEHGLYPAILGEFCAGLLPPPFGEGR
ncbi:phosphoribosylglycinamide formyltransferase [Brevundimonas sp.]|uniref:phosphoribosylglycinamide formyltransferase n=1 Tax=Brevundimonas sp. TaxID=1871086 RepID=UPI001A24AC0B|nr:phosphoribosylglycinamide formyltransferase [Brevundimonas sp.]MBJ7483962.1 phosphoribosylglycinamide formyltransferase [Brevundimonas sp.]